MGCVAGQGHWAASAYDVFGAADTVELVSLGAFQFVHSICVSESAGLEVRCEHFNQRSYCLGAEVVKNVPKQAQINLAATWQHQCFGQLLWQIWLALLWALKGQLCKQIGYIELAAVVGQKLHCFGQRRANIEHGNAPVFIYVLKQGRQ